MNGIYTIHRIQTERNITRQSAINLVYRLHKQQKVRKSKSQRGPVVYRIFPKPIPQSNGLYTYLDKTPIKLNPLFIHVVHGRPYTKEQAIVDAIWTNDLRHKMATVFLLKSKVHWTSLMQMLIKNNVLPQFRYIWQIAQSCFRTVKVPKRYQQKIMQGEKEKLSFTKEDILRYMNDN